MDEPLVSIVCTTYNHAGFIHEALDGFISQKTSFPFEIIVHDDASTDGTADIVKDYARRYPMLIKPIYQRVNQLSQGRPIDSFCLNAARGKYIAPCEGDDYWIDEYKLETQIRYMEEHPNCTLCFTNALRLNSETGDFYRRPMLPYTKNDVAILDKGNVIDTRGMLELEFLPFASFVYKKYDRCRFPKSSPDAFNGDRFIELMLTELGYAHYIDAVTCVYRVNNPNSLTSVWASNPKRNVRKCKQYIRMYKDFDAYTEGKYSPIIHKLILDEEMGLLFYSGDYKSLRKKCYLFRAASKGPYQFAAYLGKAYAPHLLSRLRATCN